MHRACCTLYLLIAASASAQDIIRATRVKAPDESLYGTAMPFTAFIQTERVRATELRRDNNLIATAKRQHPFSVNDAGPADGPCDG